MKTKFNFRVEIIVGHSFDKNGVKIGKDEAEARLDEARHLLAAKFCGFTETAATGGYVDQGTWIADESAVFTLFTNAPTPYVKEIAAQLRDLFRQSCVVCSIQLTNGELI